MENFTRNQVSYVDVTIALPDMDREAMPHVVSAYFAVKFFDVTNGLQFADEEVTFDALRN